MRIPLFPYGRYQCKNTANVYQLYRMYEYYNHGIYIEWIHLYSLWIHEKSHVSTSGSHLSSIFQLRPDGSYSTGGKKLWRWFRWWKNGEQMHVETRGKREETIRNKSFPWVFHENDLQFSTSLFLKMDGHFLKGPFFFHPDTDGGRTILVSGSSRSWPALGQAGQSWWLLVYMPWTLSLFLCMEVIWYDMMYQINLIWICCLYLFIIYHTCILIWISLFPLSRSLLMFVDSFSNIFDSTNCFRIPCHSQEGTP